MSSANDAEGCLSYKPHAERHGFVRPTLEFRWSREQPSASDSIPEVEKHSIAAHLQRFVRQHRSNVWLG